MDDKKLRDLLSENRKVPLAPGDEWSSILNKIEDEKNTKGFFGLTKWKTAMVGLTLASFMVFFMWQQDTYEQQQLVMEEYLLENSYFSESEELYSWVDYD